MIAKSSLFHFTSKIETLLTILRGLRFRASYNVEDISDFYPSEKYVGIPMICFCDIPLKFISEHPMGYGKYGIGMTKAWGLKMGINPVLYRSENFTVNKLLSQMIETIKFRISSLERKASPLLPFELTVLNEATGMQDKILQLSAFSKKYESNIGLNYLDREWRFVPQHAEMPFLGKTNQKDRLNGDYFRRSPDYLGFQVRDIKHIITPNKRETAKLIRAFRNLPIKESHKYYLAQLVVDLKSINEDF